MKLKHYFDPLLYVDIRLPFFEISTRILHTDFHSDYYIYSEFRIKIYKWHFNIVLDEPRFAKEQRLYRKKNDKKTKNN